MAYKIIWTKNASEDLEEIVDYIKNDWSEEVTEKFIFNLFSKLDLVSNYPTSGQASEKNRNVRRILISKQNYLYYEIEDKNINLLNFFDTRQDPEKDKFG